MGERYWLEGNNMKDVHEYLNKHYPKFKELSNKTLIMTENSGEYGGTRSKDLLKKLLKTRYSELDELLKEIEELEAELEEKEDQSSEIDKILLEEIENFKKEEIDG